MDIKVVNTACYVLNHILIRKCLNKTLYDLKSKKKIKYYLLDKYNLVKI